VTYRNRPIFSFPTRRSKLSYDHELDFNLAAHWWRITPLQLRELPMDEQVEMIATFRVQNQIEAVLAYEQYLESKKKKR